MPSKIIHKKSAVASNAPTIGDLEFGELALNYADGKLYYKEVGGSSIKSFFDEDLVVKLSASAGENDGFVHLSRSHETFPLFYANQYGNGPIARFLAGTGATSISSTDYFQVENDGSIFTTGDATATNFIGNWNGRAEGDFIRANANDTVLQQLTFTDSDGGIILRNNTIPPGTGITNTYAIKIGQFGAANNTIRFVPIVNDAYQFNSDFLYHFSNNWWECDTLYKSGGARYITDADALDGDLIVWDGTEDINAASYRAYNGTGKVFEWRLDRHSIICNDGSANVGIRFGHEYDLDTDSRLEYTYSGGAVEIVSNTDNIVAGNTYLQFRVSPATGSSAGGAGSAVTWDSQLRLYADKLQYTGGDLELGDNTVFIEHSTNRVSIGDVVTPVSTLHVREATNSNAVITLEDGNGDNQAIVNYRTATYDWAAGVHGGIGGYFKIAYNTELGTNDVVSIRPNGYVGFGVETAQTKVHIDDNESTGTGLLVTGGGAGGTLAKFERDVGISNTYVRILAEGAFPQLHFHTRNAYQWAIGVNNTYDHFEIGRASDKLTTSTVLFQLQYDQLRLEVDRLGVGLGGDSTELLHLNASGTNSTQGLFINDPSTAIGLYGARFMFDDAASRVQIGSRSNGVDIGHILLSRDTNETAITGLTTIDTLTVTNEIDCGSYIEADGAINALNGAASNISLDPANYRIEFGRTPFTTGYLTYAGAFNFNAQVNVTGKVVASANVECVDLDMDANITFFAGFAGTPISGDDAGLTVERGTATDVSLIWTEANTAWQFTGDVALTDNFLRFGTATTSPYMERIGSVFYLVDPDAENSARLDVEGGVDAGGNSNFTQITTTGKVMLGAEIEHNVSGNPATVFCITAEQSGAVNGGSDWSFGNGYESSNTGVILPFSCELIAMSCQIVGTSTVTMEVEVHKNGTGVDLLEILPNTNPSAYEVIATPIAFAAGDRVSFDTATGDSATTGGVMTAWFRTT